MHDDYYPSHRYPACPSSASSSSSASSKLSLKNLHVGRRTAAITTSTTAAAIDIAHLLDPAYYSPKHHTTAFMSSNQVYVDTTGETHDPDFRLFASASHSPKRREFLSAHSNPNDDEDDVDAYSYHYGGSSWGDEDKERRRLQRSSFDSYRSPSRASDPIFTYSNYQHFDQSYAYRPTNDWQEDSDVFALSEDEKERQPRSLIRSRRESNKLRRRRAESESGVLAEKLEDDELWKNEEENHVLEDGDEEMDKKERQTRSTSPMSGSTTESFRRQWLALRLRTQFAAFRARRKMTKLVRCATATAAA